MDENFIEQAERLAAAEIREGINRARHRASPPPGFDGMCDCGNLVDPRRVNLGYHRCLECQTKIEHTGRQYRT